MEENRLTYLLKKVMADQATKLEHEEMVSLLADPKLEEPALDLLLAAYFEEKKPSDVNSETRDQILNAIFSSQDKEVQRKDTWRIGVWKWVAAAAVFLVVFFISKRFNRSNLPQVQQSQVKTNRDILPGHNQATLTLADGSIVSLDEVQSGKIAQQAGFIIKKTEDGSLQYEVGGQKSTGQGKNTISTPLGGKYTVVLADKTSITLNSGSSVTYPLSFAGNKREIALQGEAYFEVSKDKHKPFIVTTDGANGITSQQVEVLGTHFNINAYVDARSYQTTLLEGRIKLTTTGDSQGIILSPGQQAQVKNNIKVVDADSEAAVAWKDDLFYFSDEPLDILMKRIARWYDIEVVFEGSAPKIGFWGQVSMKKPLSQVLENLEATGQVHFKIHGRKVTVTK